MTYPKRRDFNGFAQIRTSARDRWRFYVAGFSGEPQTHSVCRVLKSDDSFQQVPIDPQDRILINGRRYGRAHWQH